MKLIAENSFEDHILPGLVALLRDLRVDAMGFHRDEAIAPVFWSPDDFSLELTSLRGTRKEDLAVILKRLEPDIMEAMILSGFQVIEGYIHKAKGSAVYQHHRNLR